MIRNLDRGVVTTRLWVGGPAQIRRMAHACAGRDVEWYYFGTDVAGRARLARMLGVARPVEFGDALNQVAHAAKQPVLDWLADMVRRQRDPLLWWGSTLASCSPLQTDLFLLICYTQLVAQWLRTRPSQLLRIVVVEDPWLRLTLHRHLAGDPRAAVFGGALGGCAWDALGWILKSPGVVISSAVRACYSSLVASRLFPRRQDAPTPAAEGTVLLYTWIQPQCFSAPGMLTDPWLGRLETLLKARGEPVRRLGSLTWSARLLRRFQRVASDALVTSAAVRAIDIFRSVCRWFQVDGFKRLPRCLDWDYAPLVFRELVREWGQANFAFYRVGYFATRRLARQVGPQVKCVIYPFENQPWEKLFCMAWRQGAPHVKLVGYQHSWVPSLLLPYALGHGAVAKQPLPDWIVANSARSLEALQRGGYPVERLVNGGALRHEYLHVQAPGDSMESARVEPHRRVVLVTLPLLAAQAGRLLADLLEEFQQPLVVGDAPDEPVAFVLKSHPSLPVERFVHGRIRLPPWMMFSDVPMERLLQAADLFLYVPSTSSWWVAILHGVPVLKYRTDLLDIDIELEGGEALPVSACSRQTLRASLASLLRHPPARQRPDPAVLERVFGKVDEETWVALAVSSS